MKRRTPRMGVKRMMAGEFEKEYTEKAAPKDGWLKEGGGEDDMPEELDALTAIAELSESDLKTLVVDLTSAEISESDLKKLIVGLTSQIQVRGTLHRKEMGEAKNHIARLQNQIAQLIEADPGRGHVSDASYNTPDSKASSLIPDSVIGETPAFRGMGGDTRGERDDREYIATLESKITQSEHDLHQVKERISQLEEDAAESEEAVNRLGKAKKLLEEALHSSQRIVQEVTSALQSAENKEKDFQAVIEKVTAELQVVRSENESLHSYITGQEKSNAGSNLLSKVATRAPSRGELHGVIPEEDSHVIEQAALDKGFAELALQQRLEESQEEVKALRAQLDEYESRKQLFSPSLGSELEAIPRAEPAAASVNNDAAVAAQAIALEQALEENRILKAENVALKIRPSVHSQSTQAGSSSTVGADSQTDMAIPDTVSPMVMMPPPSTTEAVAPVRSAGVECGVQTEEEKRLGVTSSASQTTAPPQTAVNETQTDAPPAAKKPKPPVESKGYIANLVSSLRILTRVNRFFFGMASLVSGFIVAGLVAHQANQQGRSVQGDGVTLFSWFSGTFLTLFAISELAMRSVYKPDNPADKSNEKNTGTPLEQITDEWFKDSALMTQNFLQKYSQTQSGNAGSHSNAILRERVKSHAAQTQASVA